MHPHFLEKAQKIDLECVSSFLGNLHLWDLANNDDPDKVLISIKDPVDSGTKGAMAPSFENVSIYTHTHIF